MTINTTTSGAGDCRKIHNSYDKQSPADKPGMKGDRAAIHTTDTYTPQGANGEILRRAGSLRLTRGDIHLTTLSKKYREFCSLAIIQAKIAEHAAGGSVIGLPITLADLRGAFRETSITKIRAAIRQA